MWGAICIALFGCVFLGLGVHQLEFDRELDENVGRTTATVEKLSASVGGKGGPTYEVLYRYADQSGQVLDEESVVSRATYSNLRVGGKVPVKFLLNNATESRIDSPIEEHWNWHKDEMITGFAGVFTCVGTFLGWRAWRKSR